VFAGVLFGLWVFSFSYGLFSLKQIDIGFVLAGIERLALFSSRPRLFFWRGLAY
jgi:hypothetical protein